MVMRTGSLALAVMLLSASAAFAAECYSSTFFNGKSLVASTTSGTQFKMIFTPDGRMTRQPHLGNLIPQAFAQAGKGPKPTATPSSQAAMISGRSSSVV
jgi:hypothetical protein